MNTLSNILTAAFTAALLAGTSAALAQDESGTTPQQQAPMPGNETMPGMEGGGMQGMQGMMGMMQMMSQMSEMMENCNRMMEAKASDDAAPEADEPQPDNG